jgi:hypothetical protein
MRLSDVQPRRHVHLGCSQHDSPKRNRGKRILKVKKRFLTQGLLFLLLATRASADIANGNYFPIGDRTAFLANTACADGRSSMAVLFNPGALGFVEKSKIALSGNLYFNMSSNYEPLVRFNGEGQNVRISGFNSVPNSAVSIYKWGETTLAISVLVPEYYQSGVLQKINLTGFNAVIQFDTRQQDLWLGASLARVWREKYGLGFSVFGTRYSSYNAMSIAGSYVIGANQATSSSISHTEGAAHSVETVLGFFWKPENWLSTGVKFSPPGIRLQGSGTYYSSTVITTAGAQSATTEDRPDQRYFYQRPAQLSAGVQLQVLDQWKWYVDLNMQFPIAFQEMPAVASTASYNMQTTVRASTGLEYQINKTWSVLSGFAYLPSAVPAIEPRYAGMARLTAFLVTAGVIYSDEHVRTGLGAFFITAQGGIQIDATANNTANLGLTGLGALLTSSYEF